MAAKERGRPKFREGDALSERVTTRFRPAEVDEVRAAAEAAGLSVAQWMREVALAAARRPQAKTKRAKKKPKTS